MGFNCSLGTENEFLIGRRGEEFSFLDNMKCTASLDSMSAFQG